MLETHLSLMSIILDDIVFRDPCQLFVSSGSLRMVSTILAPWIGGLEYIGLAIPFNLVPTAFASFSSPQTTETHPALSP